MAREQLKTYLPMLIQEKAINWLDTLMARFRGGGGVEQQLNEVLLQATNCSKCCVSVQIGTDFTM